MRLIDVDELFKQAKTMLVCNIVTGKDEWSQMLNWGEIDKAPTIEAIPIKWIENYTRRNFPLANGEIVLGFMADMLEKWKKEND